MNRHGESRIGCVFTLLVVGLVFYVAWHFVPSWYNAFSFQDEVSKIAQSASSQRWKEDDVRKRILEAARTYEQPITKDHIRYERRGDYLTISVQYTVMLDFRFYEYPWERDLRYDNLTLRF